MVHLFPARPGLSLVQPGLARHCPTHCVSKPRRQLRNWKLMVTTAEREREGSAEAQSKEGPSVQDSEPQSRPSTSSQQVSKPARVVLSDLD